MFDNANTQESQTRQQFSDEQLRIHEYLKDKRKPYEPLMDEVCAMFAPELYMRPGNGASPGRRFAEDIWDGTPQLALKMWSEGIPGNMIYRDEKWLTQRVNVSQLMQEPSVRDYCEKKTEQVFWAFRRTNFYDINGQFCRYSGTMGGYLFPIIDRESRSVNFYNEDPWCVWVERDIFGKVCRVHRETNQTLDSLARQFGKESLHKNHWVQLQPGKGNPYQEIEVLHGIFPNPDWDMFSLDGLKKPYVEFYIDRGMRHLMYFGGTDYLPVDWCVERHPRGGYALTPAMFALTDAYGADTLSRSLFNVALEAGDPQMMIAESIKANYRTGPGSITYVADSAKELVQQVRKQLNWPISDQERERITSRIERWFSVPYWNMMSAMDGGNPPTAYQVRQVQAEKATLLGPQVGTYTTQVLDAAVDIVSQQEASYEPIDMPDILQAYLAYQASRSLSGLGYEPSPDQVIRYSAKYPSAWLEAKYNGVLTSIQSELLRGRRYADAFQAIQAMEALWPEIKFIVNPYPFARNVLQASDLTQEEIKTPEQYAEVVQMLQEQHDVQAQVEQNKANADSYKKLVRAPQDGSPAKEMMQQNAA